MRIQHNIMAMNAYRNYNNNTSALSKNLEKLSSGYKINRAGDDAAGLAISEKMRAQITGLETAQKNAKDGISLVQTAEGALTEVHDMLNRMVELATQSANGTYDNETDRANLQKEVDQLREEIDRIADSANFNGIDLLNGNMKASDPEMSTVGVTGMTTTFTAPETAQKGSFQIDLGDLKIQNTSTGTATVTVAIGDKEVTITVAGSKGMTSEEIASAVAKQLTGSVSVVNSATAATFTVSATGSVLTFTMSTEPKIGDDASDFVTDGITFTISGNDIESNSGEPINSTTITATKIPTLGQMADGSIKFTKDQIVDGTTLKIGQNTYTFAVGKDSKYAGGSNVIDLTKLDDKYFDASGKLTDDGLKEALRAFTRTAGTKNSEVTISFDGTDTLQFKTKADIDQSKYEGMKLSETNAADCSWGNFVQMGNAADSASGGLTLQIGDTADEFNKLKVSIDDMHCSSLKLDTISIAKQEDAADAVDVIKAAINQVSSVRGTLGATQNRLDHTINNLSVMTENIQDAESTIRDTDVADEMMAYTKNNILVQSAQAMLAQANQVPQGVLQLLQ